MSNRLIYIIEVMTVTCYSVNGTGDFSGKLSEFVKDVLEYDGFHDTEWMLGYKRATMNAQFVMQFDEVIPIWARCMAREIPRKDYATVFTAAVWGVLYVFKTMPTQAFFMLSNLQKAFKLSDNLVGGIVSNYPISRAS